MLKLLEAPDIPINLKNVDDIETTIVQSIFSLCLCVLMCEHDFTLLRYLYEIISLFFVRLCLHSKRQGALHMKTRMKTMMPRHQLVASFVDRILLQRSCVGWYLESEKPLVICFEGHSDSRRARFACNYCLVQKVAEGWRNDL